MSTSCIEHTYATQIPAAAISPGTSVTIPTTENQDFVFMTVFNESDKAVKVNYATEDGGGAMFIVPSGFTDTRKTNSPIVNDSIKINSMHSTLAASGNITVNLGN
jgi:hypothetical protein